MPHLTLDLPVGLISTHFPPKHLTSPPPTQTQTVSTNRFHSGPQGPRPSLHRRLLVYTASCGPPQLFLHSRFAASLRASFARPLSVHVPVSRETVHMWRREFWMDESPITMREVSCSPETETAAKVTDPTHAGPNPHFSTTKEKKKNVYTLTYIHL